MLVLIRTLYWMERVVSLALLCRVILSWVVTMNFGRENIPAKIYDVLVRYTEPIVAPVRNLINKHFRTGMIDWSIFATMILLGLVVNIVVRVLLMLV